MQLCQRSTTSRRLSADAGLLCVTRDLRLTGQVSWTGTSSMEVRLCPTHSNNLSPRPSAVPFMRSQGVALGLCSGCPLPTGAHRGPHASSRRGLLDVRRACAVCHGGPGQQYGTCSPGGAPGAADQAAAQPVRPGALQQVGIVASSWSGRIALEHGLVACAMHSSPTLCREVRKRKRETSLTKAAPTGEEIAMLHSVMKGALSLSLSPSTSPW